MADGVGVTYLLLRSCYSSTKVGHNQHQIHMSNALWNAETQQNSSRSERT